ncbi:MAG: hypothetical protein JW940_05310 [Polyangiaceae bacterium]|nr:hypothetical protein [Polyangiaceae bacterium]
MSLRSVLKLGCLPLLGAGLFACSGEHSGGSDGGGTAAAGATTTGPTGATGGSSSTGAAGPAAGGTTGGGGTTTGDTGGSGGTAPAAGGTAGTGGGGLSNAGGTPGSGGSGIGGTSTSGGGRSSATGGKPDTGGSGGTVPAAGGAESGGGESAGASVGGAGGGGTGGTGPFQGKELFILFGQSNMSGMSPMPEEPWPINESITFMVQYDCPRLGQTKDEWLPAEPPLHGCQWATGGIGLGLADYFGVALAEAWPDSEIGLIPNAIPAVTIDVFMKGGPSPGGGMKALPDGYTSAYALMVDRAREAQKLGQVRGILLHQGESDFNQGLGEEWLGKLTQVVADLRADLDLTEDVPFIAGEISPESSYSGHNVYVRQVPGAIPQSAVVSADGTRIHDIAHFDEESARTMGERYAETFLEMVTPQ